MPATTTFGRSWLPLACIVATVVCAHALHASGTATPAAAASIPGSAAPDTGAAALHRAGSALRAAGVLPTLDELILWDAWDVSGWMRVFSRHLAARTLPIDWDDADLVQSLPAPAPPHVLDHLEATGSVSGLAATYATVDDLVYDVGVAPEDAEVVIDHLRLLTFAGRAAAHSAADNDARPMAPMDFWSWRALNREKAEHYPRALLSFPRISIVYAYIFHYDDVFAPALHHAEKHARERASSVAAGETVRDDGAGGNKVPDLDVSGVGVVDDGLQGVELALETLPPSDTVNAATFWLLVAVAPHLLMAWHAVSFFHINYWVTLVYVTALLGAWATELNDVWKLLTRRMSLAAYRASLVKTARFMTAVYFLWPFIPWIVCDAWFYVSFTVQAVGHIATPVYRVWRGGLYNYISAAGYLALLTLPHMYDDTSLWDVAVLLLIGVPCVVLAARASRAGVGRMTPSQAIRFFAGDALATLPGMLIIDRENLLESSVRQLSEVPVTRLRGSGRVAVSFRTSSGVEEEGIDAGGLFRSWMSMLAAHVFDPSHGYVVAEQMPDDDAAVDADGGDGAADAGISFARISGTGAPVGSDATADRVYRSVGRLLGMSYRQRQPLGIDVAPPLCNLIVADEVSGYKVFDASDLRYARSGHYKFLRRFAAAGDAASIEALALTFVGDAPDGTQVPLMDAGAETGVTLDNVDAYMRRLAHFEFVSKPGVTPALLALRAGFRDVVEAGQIPLTGAELGAVLSGERGVSVADLKATTAVQPSDEATGEVMRAFWAEVEAMSDAEREALLLWATGLRRVPSGSLRGGGGGGDSSFGGPVGSVMSVVLTPGDTDRLPVAHTCNRQIDLPRYGSREVLGRKLRIAMAETGFGLA